MVSIGRIYPRVVYLGEKVLKDCATVGGNVGHGHRKRVDGAGAVDVDGSCRTTQRQSVGSGATGRPLEGNSRRSKR